jgi:hypothetical protein
VIYYASCLIYRDESKKKILLGVRQSCTPAERHRQILCLPVIQVPRILFNAVTGTLHTDLEVGEVRRLNDKSTAAIGEGVLQIPDTFLIESLLAQGLDLGEPLIMGLIRGRASAIAIALDQPTNARARPADHRYMVTYAMTLTSGADLIPPAAGDYSKLLWAEKRLVSQAVQANDIRIMSNTLDLTKISANNLCIRSIRHELGHQADPL